MSFFIPVQTELCLFSEIINLTLAGANAGSIDPSFLEEQLSANIA